MVRETQGRGVRTDARTTLARCDLSLFHKHTLHPPILAEREVIFIGGVSGGYRAPLLTQSLHEAWLAEHLPHMFSRLKGSWDRTRVRRWLNRECDGIWAFSFTGLDVVLRFSDPTAATAARLYWG